MVGKNTKKIQEYIANQLKEDWETDQMTLNEYIDPFTGEPVQKSKKLSLRGKLEKVPYRGRASH